MAELYNTPAAEPLHSNRVSWGAVIAGVLVALTTQVLLGMLGLAIGLTALDPLRSQDYGNFGVGSGIWLAISTIISVFVGAWTTSWWANDPYRGDGILHGVLTWSLFMVVTLFMVGSGLGTILGGAFNLASSSLTGVGQEVQMEGNPVGTAQRNVANIQNRLAELMPEAVPVTEELQDIGVSPQVRRQIAQRITDGDEAGATALIQRHTGLNSAQSRQIVEESQMEPREVAENVTDTASQIAWWAFLATILSLVAGAIGGRVGTRNPYVRGDIGRA